MATAVQASIGFIFAASLAASLAGCHSGDGAGTSGVAASSSTTVNAVDTSPTISGGPTTSVLAGTHYSFTPTTSDPSGAALAFSIKNMPAWATFSATTGTLSGVPAVANVGNYAQIAISASNGTTSVALAPFTISVAAAPVSSSSLTIAGTPAASVSVGAPYSFRPTTADAAGAKLVFSVDNKPSWASFDSTTGTLSGTPGPANTGIAAHIVIHVSDGVNTAALPGFSVTVNSGATDSVTLSWTPPTNNADGTPATDLSGYRIYYGTSASSLGNVVTVEGVQDNKQVIGNLSAGTWYFAVTSLNAQKIESKLSEVVPISL